MSITKFKGYTKITTVTGPSIESTAKDRFAGFIHAMNEYDILVDEASIIKTSFMYEDAWQKFSKQFDKRNIPETILTYKESLGSLC